MQTGIVAAVSCTKAHNVTGNKYKFVQIVQETAADDRVLTVAIDKLQCVIADAVPALSPISKVYGQ